MTRLGLVVWALLAMGLGMGPAVAQKVLPQSAVVTENLEFDARDEGFRLHLRNKHPDDYYNPTPERTVLFVHGAIYPGITTFDQPVEGQSWMDFLARRGYDVYAIDIRGYGHSTKPPEMSQPAAGKPPLVDNVAALRDLSKTVEYITSRRGIDRVTIVGWGWGATLTGTYAADTPNRIFKLVLMAPPWVADAPVPAEALAEVGAWRSLPLALVGERWGQGLPEKERRDLVSDETRKAWLAALAAGTGGEPVLKLPNGAIADAIKTWGAGQPAWRPERISAPTLVVQGEWDADIPPAMGLSVFAHLSGTSTRRFVLVGEGTHLLLLERNRRQLYQVVLGFLEEVR